jgi:hypothetical protein
MSEASPDTLLRVNEGLPRSCPVCKKATYSREGIHPQCAERERDRARMKQLRDNQRAAKEAHKRANPIPLKPFHRHCPSCSADVPPRVAECSCGYRFQLEPSVPKGFHRRCPNCRLQVHIRLLVCSCGYEFPRLRLEKRRARRGEAQSAESTGNQHPHRPSE